VQAMIEVKVFELVYARPEQLYEKLRIADG
jgi:hypothetical protein